jgi:hypothetical protein
MLMLICSSCSDLENILAFIYNGEVNVEEDELEGFLRTAKALEITGLAEEEISPGQNHHHLHRHPSSSS